MAARMLGDIGFQTSAQAVSSLTSTRPIFCDRQNAWRHRVSNIGSGGQFLHVCGRSCVTARMLGDIGFQILAQAVTFPKQ